MAESVDQLAQMADYVSLLATVVVGIIISLMAYLLRRSIKQVDDDLKDVKDWIHGSSESEGIVSRVTALESVQSETRKDVDDLNKKVDDMQSQIVENQRTLTRHIVGVDKKIERILGYLEAKKD